MFNMHTVDKFAGIAFKVMVVLYVLVIAARHSFRPDIYRMVSVPIESFVGLLLVYIGGKWALRKLGFLRSGSIEISRRAILKTLGAVAVLILFGATIEIICHNLALTQQATEDLQTSREGSNLLGNPIRIGWLISGNIRSNGDGGAASFSIPVKGSKAAGNLEVTGIRKDGSWTVAELYLIVDGNTVQIPH